MQHIFSLRDLKAGIHMNPFFAAHAAIALRMVTDFASDPQTIIAKHPSDFALYRIGTFEPDSGVIYAEQVPVFISDVQSLINKKGDTNA